MASEESVGLSTSMVLAGSTVAVVGIVLSLTNTMAFVMMIAFGAAVAAAGIFLSKRSHVSAESGQADSKQG